MKKQVKIIAVLILSAVLIMALIGCEDSSDAGGDDGVSYDLRGTWRSDTMTMQTTPLVKGYSEYVFGTNTVKTASVVTESNDLNTTVGRYPGPVFTITSTVSDGQNRIIHYLDGATPDNFTLTFKSSTTFTFEGSEDIFTKQ